MNYSICDFGASVLHTAADNGRAIQRAVDYAAAQGGGTVVVPAGRYETAHIRLRSHICMELQAGAVLVGSERYEDCICSSTPYPSVDMMGIPSPAADTCWAALLWAEDAEDITVCGSGTLEGRGMYYPVPDDPMLRRPMLLFFERCSRVRVRDVTLRNPSMYALLASRSRELRLEGLRVDSWETENGDGLDFNGCEDVMIRDCLVESGDDAISLKATYPDAPCRNVVICGCILRGVWSGFRMGTESTASMENILLNQCVMERCSDGIKIQDCAAGVYENVRITNISMREVHRPVFMTINSFRLSKYDSSIRPPMGGIRDIVIDGLNAYMAPTSGEYQRNCMVLSGSPGEPLKNITLRNMQVYFCGEAEPDSFERVDVPEFLDYSFLYADIFSINGGYPASGIFLRHIDGLTMENCRLIRRDDDPRPLLMGYDLAGVSLQNVAAQGGGGFFQTQDSDIQLCSCTYGGEAAALAPFPAHLLPRYRRFVQESTETDEYLDTLARTVDRAQACPVQRAIEPERWEKDGDCWQTSVTLCPGTQWLLLVSCGDVAVFVNEKPVGQCVLPKNYRNLCAWAVELCGIQPGSATITLRWLEPDDRNGPVCRLPFGAFTAMQPGLYATAKLCGQEELS